MMTGTAFVDLSAAYDTVNHILLIQELFNIRRRHTIYIFSEPVVKQKIICGAEQQTKQM